MAIYTSNYNLLIPQEGEAVDASTMEGNLRIIDTLGSNFVFLIDFSDNKDAIEDSLASKGKAISASLVSNSSDTFFSANIPNLKKLGRYSINIRLKSSYNSSASTDFIKVEFYRVRNDVETLLGQGTIREKDVYQTTDYCNYALAVEIGNSFESTDTYKLKLVGCGNSNAATINIDYIAIDLATSTIIAIN